MRKLLTLLLILCSLSVTSAQWIAQGTLVDQCQRVFPVNKDVAWAVLIGNPPGHYARTVDGGAHWTIGTVTPAPANFTLTCLVPLNADTAWATLHDNSGQTSGGVFRTNDAGVTWTKQETAFPGSGGWPDFIYFFDANDGLCEGPPNGGYFEIYTTSNGGGNWERVPEEEIPDPFSNETESWSDFSFSGGVFCFGTAIFQGYSQARMLKSTDRGHTWTAWDIGLVGDNPWTNVAFSDSLNGLATAVNANSGLPYGVVRTTDGGITWTRASSPPIPAVFIGSIPGIPGGYVVGSAFTLDSGTTWTLIDTLPHTIPTFLSKDVGWCGGGGQSNRSVIYKWNISSGREITAFPNRISFGTYEIGHVSDLDTVYITNYSSQTLTISNVIAPGSNFKLINPPALPVELATLHTLFLSLQFTPQATGSFHDSVVVVSDASNAPKLAVPLRGTELIITKAPAGTMYAASSSLHTINTSTGAATAQASLGAVQIHSLAIRPSTMELYGVCGSANSSTLYRIDCITGGMLPVCTIPKANLRSIAFSPSDTLYTASLAGELYRIDLKTGEARLVGASSGFSYAGLAFHPLTGQLWASFTNKGDKIYTVDTQTGAVTLLGATGDNVRTVSLAFSSDGKLYGLKGTGTQINKLISINTSTGAGTEIGSTGVKGLLSIAMSPGTTGVEGGSSKRLPQSYALAQNYPNPFNPITSISYNLPEEGKICIKIFNILGEKVYTLVDETKRAGCYTATWNGRDSQGRIVSSGIYIYQMQSGSFTQSRRMILLH